tara:strand:+ start:293 stop:793 length:501 start_codon:yes stop_codon:yes gene_type:complete
MNKSWPIFYKRKIDSTVEDLWKLIAKPGNLNLVHPFCKSNEIIKWDGVGSSDVLVYLNGLTYFREFTEWEINKGYTLLIGSKRGPKSKVVWEITSSNNSTYLSITVYPHLLNNWPKLFSFIPYAILIKPRLKSYLKSVIGGINWHLINKVSLPKNHFGKHIWFSKL